MNSKRIRRLMKKKAKGGSAGWPARSGGQAPLDRSAANLARSPLAPKSGKDNRRTEEEKTNEEQGTTAREDKGLTTTNRKGEGRMSNKKQKIILLVSHIITGILSALGAHFGL